MNLNQDMKKAILFSGGKDSFFALQKSLEQGAVDFLIGIESQAGDTQLHAGPEVNKAMRQAQLESLGLPYLQLTLGAGENYLHELFVGLQALVQENEITHLVTGDLWHSYTSGIADMLAGALNVKLIRPAREVCSAREHDMVYMSQVITYGIESVIVSVRQGSLPENFVGKIIDKALINKLAAMRVDAAAEGGEYQSFVLAAPIMKGRIIIDEYSLSLVDGKNGKEKFHRMCVNKFHIQ